MPDNPSCSTCRFWKENEHYKEDLNSPGWCRRYAPYPRLLMEDDQSVTTKMNEVVWPVVGEDTWCGEHEPRVPTDLSAALRSVWVDRPVRDLLLSTRAENALCRAGIEVVRDLVTKTEGELMLLKNFGRTSLIEVEAQLSRLGLSLKAPRG